MSSENLSKEIKDQKIGVQFNPEIKHENIDDKNFIINFSLNISTEPKKLFDIDIELTGKCKLIKEGVYNFEEFTNEQGLGLLWPYARELVADITQRFGFPALILPTLQIKAVKE